MPPPPFAPRPVPALIQWAPGPNDQFATLTAHNLGGMGTPDDGFDADFAAILSVLDDTERINRAADQALLALPGVDEAFASASLDQFSQEVAGDVSGLEGLNADFQSAVESFAAPPDLPATPADVNLPDFQVPEGLLTPAFGPNLPTAGADILGTLEKVMGGLGTFAKSLVGLVETALLAVPIYGWIAAGIAAVIGLLWHGADPNQVPAATTEQVFELAGDGFYHLFQAQYIDRETLAGLLASMIAEGAKREQALEQQYGEVTPFQNGITNMTRVLGDLYTAAQAVPNFTPQRLDLMAAQQVWDAQPKAGWYDDAVTVAKKVYDSAVNSIIGRQ